MTSDTALPVELLPFGPEAVAARLRYFAEINDSMGRVVHGQTELMRQVADFLDAWNTRALSATRTDLWEPIETAPKDGTLILVCSAVASKDVRQSYNGMMAVDCWKQEYNGFGKFNDRFYPASHWQPLPAPPITTEGE